MDEDTQSNTAENPTVCRRPIGRGLCSFKPAAGHRRGPGTASFTEVDTDGDQESHAFDHVYNFTF